MSRSLLEDVLQANFRSTLRRYEPFHAERLRARQGASFYRTFLRQDRAGETPHDRKIDFADGN
jgi:hypothetical protein